MSGAKILGHRVHPMLVVFPLGLLGGSVAFDVAWLGTRDTTFTPVAYWLLVAGLLGGGVALVFGLWDWLAIPPGTRAKRVGLQHAVANVTALALFAVSWRLRAPADACVPGGPALGASFAGLFLALVGGWLGGELVERLGIGVEGDANPDAPSSLEPHRPVPPRAVARPAPLAR